MQGRNILRRLSLTDLPRDQYNMLRNIRGALVAVYNESRRCGVRRKLLIEVLETILGELKAGESKQVESAVEAIVSKSEDKAEETALAKRTAILEEAKSLGIDLDERQNNTNLAIELKKAKAKQAKSAKPTKSELKLY